MSAVAENRRFVRLRDKALAEGWLTPPPFSTETRRAAWQSGYADALADIAAGKFDPVVASDKERES